MARATATLLPAIFLAAAAAACTEVAKDPEKLSDRFVDLYFLELDLSGALALTEGAAKQRVERDLDLAQRTRETTPIADRRPRVYYDRPTRQKRAEDMLHSTYRLDIKSGEAELTREVVVIAAKRGEVWRVIGFREVDEPGSGGAPGIGVRTATSSEAPVRTASAARPNE